MALTATQRAQVRLYMGWSARFFQFDSELEQAMNALDQTANSATLALLTNAINGTPPGLLAALVDVDAKMVDAHGRFKASTVGSIELNEMEIKQLAKEGKRLVSRLATILGVEVRNDIFGGVLPNTRSSRWGQAGGNYQMQG